MLLLSVPEINGNLLNNLKKTVFYDLLNMAGRVFVVVQYSDSVTIGKRGFLPDEKENGMVLVFNPGMNFRWEDNAINATLSFGARAHKCHIPANDIIAIYSPEAQAQLTTGPMSSINAEDLETSEPSSPDIDKKSEKVVQVDFRKKKK